MSVCPSLCNVGVLRLDTGRDRVVFFGVRVTTEDNYFVLDRGSDPPKRETSTFIVKAYYHKNSAVATPRSAIQAVAEIFL